jgi:hypothetical protein
VAILKEFLIFLYLILQYGYILLVRKRLKAIFPFPKVHKTNWVKFCDIHKVVIINKKI